MSAEKMVVCNSVRESLDLYNEFVELMDQLGELKGARGTGRVVYLKTGEKYMFISFNEKYRFVGFRGETVSSEIFEAAMEIYRCQNNA